MPSPLTPLAGAVLGAGAAWAASRAAWRVPARLAQTPVLVAAALVLGALLAVPADGYLGRHAQQGVFASGVTGWLARQQAEDSLPVASAPLVVGPLAGDRLRHRLEPIPAGESCDAVRARARRGYVVLYVGPPGDADVTRLQRCMRRPPAHRDDAFRAWGPVP
jgi:hypothetical protein